MPFTLFRARFREIADRETRSITLLRESESGLPTGEYAFVEMFCDEDGCDCRRVLLMVHHGADCHCEAVINFGWEDAGFYADWLHSDDEDMVAAVKGPALHLGPAQGAHANAILDVAKETLFADAAYVARLKRHYAMFREDVEQQRRRSRVPVRRIKIGRNEPCPCGSGRKYKVCCATKARDASAEA